MPQPGVQQQPERTPVKTRPNARTKSRFMRESFRWVAGRPAPTPADAGQPPGGKGGVRYEIWGSDARAVFDRACESTPAAFEQPGCFTRGQPLIVRRATVL